MRIEVRGLAEVQKKFAALPRQLQVQLRLALVESLRDIKRTADTNHRFTSRTGLLEREGLDFELLEGEILSGRIYESHVVSYARYIHLGTPPHQIAPRDKKTLRWSTNNGFAFARMVHHPGTKADPYLFRAARLKREDVRSKFRTAVEQSLKERV